MRCNRLRNGKTLQLRLLGLRCDKRHAQLTSGSAVNSDSKSTVNMRSVPFLMLILLLALQGGCASVTIHPTEQVPSDRQPDFEQSVPFPWFGLSGTHHFDVQALCQGRQAIQIKTLHTFGDLMKGLKTVFFRLPKTAQIWCAQSTHSEASSPTTSPAPSTPTE